MKLIEFSELNIKLLVILIFPAFNTIEFYSKKLYLTDDNLLFMPFRHYISYIFSFIILLIVYQKNKSLSPELDEEDEENNKYLSMNNKLANEIPRIIEKRDKTRKIKSLMFLITLSIINLWCYLYIFIFSDIKYEFAKQSIGVFFDIGFYTLLSFFILKQKLYKHHFFSLIVIAVLLLALFIISIFYMDKNKIFHSCIYYCFYSFNFSLWDVLGKKYFNESYNTPYFMLTVVGSINAIVLLIYDIFAYYFNRNISGVIIGFQKNIKNALNFFGFILDLILGLFWNMGIWLTIYYFTPCHFFICEYISEYIIYLMNANDSNEKFYSTNNIVIYSIVYFINIFCCLVFNEVIILNFCNLDYNSKKRIKERMRIDGTAPSDESIRPISTDNDDNLAE